MNEDEFYKKLESGELGIVVAKEVVEKLKNSTMTRDEENVYMPGIFRVMPDNLKTPQICRKAFSWDWIFWNDDKCKVSPDYCEDWFSWNNEIGNVVDVVSVYEHIPESLGKSKICEISLDYSEERISDMLKINAPFRIIVNDILRAVENFNHIDEEDLTDEIREKAVNVFKLAQSWIMTKHSKEGKKE